MRITPSWTRCVTRNGGSPNATIRFLSPFSGRCPRNAGRGRQSGGGGRDRLDDGGERLLVGRDERVLSGDSGEEVEQPVGATDGRWQVRREHAFGAQLAD